MANMEYWLSIWEIAHRWCGHDPDHTDPKKLPLEVQDHLRSLTRSLAVYEEFHVHSENGVQCCNPSDVVQFEQYNLDESDLTTREEDYWQHYDARTKKFNSAINDLDLCYKKRKYDKQKLEDIFLAKPEVYSFAKNKGLPIPEFWISDFDIKEFETEKNVNYKPSNSESIDERIPAGRHSKTSIDRLVCRAVAEAFWTLDPEMTIGAIDKHTVTQIHGNSNLYTSKNTVRNWIKDLRPLQK
jgi:hypothetical protein